MKLTDIIKVQVIPITGYEMEPDQVVPNGEWSPTGDGKYERSGFVKDFIGINVRMKRQDATQYTLNVLSNNNAWGITTGSGKYNINEPATIGAVANTGYKFVQWQDGNTDNPRSILVTGNLNFIANFALQQVTYTIRVNVKSGQSSLGTVTGGGNNLPAGSEVRILATPNTGCKFVRWSDGSTEPDRTIPVNGNKTYTAEFASIQYNVTVKSNNTTWGIVNASPAGGIYTEGSTVRIWAIANAGYRFVRWSDGNTLPDRNITVTGIATYTAYFEAIPQTTASVAVKSADPGMGYTSPAGTNIFNIGETILIQAFCNPGFQFVKWRETGESEMDFEYYVSGNASFTAEFEPIEGDYCIIRTSCDPVDGGFTDGQGTYARGEECTLKAVAYDGYKFACWKIGEITITEPVYTFNVEENINAVAIFEHIEPHGSSWDVFIKDGALWIENEETHEQLPLEDYGEMQGDTLYFDAATLSSISEGGFTMSYTSKDGEEVTITDNGVYADFNMTDNLIESIVNVTDMIDGDTNTAKYAITILREEQRAEVTQKYIDGDPDWWKLDTESGGGDGEVIDLGGVSDGESGRD